MPDNYLAALNVQPPDFSGVGNAMNSMMQMQQRRQDMERQNALYSALAGGDINAVTALDPAAGSALALTRQRQGELTRQNSLDAALRGGNPDEVSRYDPTAATNLQKYNVAKDAESGWQKYAAAAIAGDPAAAAELARVAPEHYKTLTDIQQNKAQIDQAVASTIREDAKAFLPMLGSQLLAADAETNPQRRQAALQVARATALQMDFPPQQVDAVLGSDALGAVGMTFLAAGTAAQGELAKGAFGPTELKPGTNIPPAARAPMGLGAAGAPAPSGEGLPSMATTPGGGLAVGAPNAGGLYTGEAADSQNWNMLFKYRDQRNTPQYQTAWAELTKPHYQMFTGDDGQQYQFPVPPIQMPEWALPPDGTAPIATSGASNAEFRAEIPLPGAKDVAMGGYSPDVLVAKPNTQLPPGAIPLGNKPPTEQQTRARSMFNVAVNEEPIIDSYWTALANPSAQLLSIGGDMTRWAQSDEYQRARNAIVSLVQSYQYVASGASTPEPEAQRLAQTLIPGLGEHEGAIQDKRNRVQFYIDAIKTAANFAPGKAPTATVAAPGRPGAGAGAGGVPGSATAAPGIITEGTVIEGPTGRHTWHNGQWDPPL